MEIIIKWEIWKSVEPVQWQSTMTYFALVHVESSHLAGRWGVSGHRLGREVKIWVRAVKERLSPLAVGLEDQTWARTGVQWTAPNWQPIFHIETATERQVTGEVNYVREQFDSQKEENARHLIKGILKMATFQALPFLQLQGQVLF